MTQLIKHLCERVPELAIKLVKLEDGTVIEVDPTPLIEHTEQTAVAVINAVREVAKSKKRPELEEPHEMADQRRWDLWESMCNNDEVYNQALDDVLDLLDTLEGKE